MHRPGLARRGRDPGGRGRGGPRHEVTPRRPRDTNLDHRNGPGWGRDLASVPRPDFLSLLAPPFVNRPDAGVHGEFFRRKNYKQGAETDGEQKRARSSLLILAASSFSAPLRAFLAACTPRFSDFSRQFTARLYRPWMPSSAHGIDGEPRRSWSVRRGALSPSLRLHWPSIHCPLATVLSPLATRHSPLATRHSPLGHSPLDAASPLATRHSPPA